jgi:hypothetical protein
MKRVSLIFARGLALWLVNLPLLAGPAAIAQQQNATICCRASGGTRSSCLNTWIHLVPPGNRFQPGPSRDIALLQGPSAGDTAMTVQLLDRRGQLVGEQTLPAERGGIWLLTLPQAGPAALQHPLVWESFPRCRPNTPPSRTLLDMTAVTATSDAPRALAALSRSCGGTVQTGALLQALELEEFSTRLPVSLPVRCLRLTAGSLGMVPSPDRPSRP